MSWAGRIRGIRSPISKGFLLGSSDGSDTHPIKPRIGLTLRNRILDLFMTGDVRVDDKSNATVVGIQGVPVDDTAPATNDVLKFDGTNWAPAAGGGGGSGDFVGPGSSVAGHFVSFAGGTGKLGADSGVSAASFDAAGDAAAAQAAAEAYTDSLLTGGTTGQVLTKDSNTNLDFSWQTPSGGGGGALPSLTILQRSSNQSISNVSTTDVSWDASPIQDDVGAFSSGSPTILTVPSGYTKVRVTAHISWESNNSGQRYVDLQVNGTTIDTNWYLPASESTHSFVTRWHTVAASDVLKLRVFQSSGGSLNFAGAGSGYGWPYMQVEWAA